MTVSTAIHYHTAFGLLFRSSLPLPEMRSAESGEPDVNITEGAVPMELADATVRGVRYQAAPGKLLLRVDRVARYLISDGREIVIEREEGGTDDDVRLFLLGSAVGAMLHQRQDLVLHGSSIAVGDFSVAFVGVSGAGKSTLAMAFQKKGYPVVTDDLCVVRSLAPGQPLLAHPGPPQSKLWLDSLKHLEIGPDSLRKIRPALEKRAYPLEGAMATAPLPLRKIYLLSSFHQTKFELVPVKGDRKFLILKNHTYRFGFVGGLGAKPSHFQKAMALAQQARVTTAIRPDESFRLDEFTGMIEADFKS